MEGSMLSSQWKVPSLVALEETFCLVANGRFQCLVAFRMFHAWWSMGKHLFHLFSFFPPNKFYLKFFSLILKFYFTMVLDHYFTFFLLFPWPINCNHAFQCTKSSTRSSPNWFWSKIFSFPWIHGVAHDHVLRASNHINEWRTTLGVVLRFDIGPTPSWWKSRTAEGASLFWNWTPLSLVLSQFFELSYLGDFVAGWPH